MNAPAWQPVLDFWFNPGDPSELAAPGKARAEWFRNDAAFDATIRARFAGFVEAALEGGLRDWDATAPGALARILLLDQFTRNIYRDTSRAFAGDTLALAAADVLIDAGDDRKLPPLQRWFAYLPFEHAEDIAMQERAVELFGLLAEEKPSLLTALDYAIRHRDVIVRFGRFPHRNAILGRASSAEETEFLRVPGSGF
jgi:uncharacterized protein (DUF924 family)